VNGGLKRRRLERLELMDKAAEIVEGAGKPVSIDYVAYRLSISWHVARALLLELAARGRLKMIDTTRGILFTRGDA